MTLCSCRDVCSFCRGFSHLLSTLYTCRIAHLLVLLFLLWTMSGSCHEEVVLLWLSRLSPMARAPWRWVHIRRPNIRWAGEVLSPSIGVFLQLSRERKLLAPDASWLSWLSSLQSWLCFLLVHCFGGSQGSWLHAQSQMIIKISQILQS